jgi:ComF family protein
LDTRFQGYFGKRINRVNSFFHLIFPNCCVHCGNELSVIRDFLCFGCESKVNWSEPHHTKIENRVQQGINDKHVASIHTLFIFEKEGVEQSVIHHLKYRNSAQTGNLFGRKLALKFLKRNEIKDIECIIPVPVFHRKKFDRGYNQAEQISKGLAAVLNIPVRRMVTKRTQTVSQTKLTREERLLNVNNTFKASQDLLQFKSIALVDDVITTGATLRAICQEITSVNESIRITVFSLGVAKFH